MSDLADTLKKRGSKYGPVGVQFSVAQRLKEIVHGDPMEPNRYSPVQREALDMICTKLSRLITGDPNEIDTWHDIAGYASLVEEQIQQSSSLTTSKTEQKAYVLAQQSEKNPMW